MSDKSVSQTTRTLHREYVASEEEPRKATGIQIEDPHAVLLDADIGQAERPSAATFMAIFSLALSTVATITVPAVLVPGILFQIGAALGDVGSSLWLINSWAVASSTTAVLGGQLSDIFGRRYVILGGQALAVVGSVVGATAHTIGSGLAASTILGFAAGIILSIWAAVPELVPFKYRGVSISLIEFVLCVPWVAFSVLLGQMFLVHATWRWCYIIGVIYSVLSITGTAIFYWPPARNRNDLEKSTWQQVLDLDWIGLILWTGGSVAFLVGLAWAGTDGHAWNSASVIGPIVVGICALIACFTYDFFAIPSEKALFPLSLFRMVREYTLNLTGTFVGGMIYTATSGLLPRATLYLFTSDPTRIGILSLPNGIAQTLGPLVFPAIMHFLKRPKWFLLGALVVQGSFTAAMAYGAQGHVAAWAGLQIFVQGLFTSIVIASVVISSLHVKHSQLGLAVGILSAIRTTGGSIGTVILSTILQSAADKRVSPSIARAALDLQYPEQDLSKLIPAVFAHASGVPDSFAGVPGVTPALITATLQAFRQSWGQAFSIMFYATIPFSVVAIIAISFVKDPTEYLTNHTAVVMVRSTAGRKVKTSPAAGNQLEVEKDTL